MLKIFIHESAQKKKKKKKILLEVDKLLRKITDDLIKKGKIISY